MGLITYPTLSQMGFIVTFLNFVTSRRLISNPACDQVGFIITFLNFLIGKGLICHPAQASCFLLHDIAPRQWLLTRLEAEYFLCNDIAKKRWLLTWPEANCLLYNDIAERCWLLLTLIPSLVGANLSPGLRPGNFH